jgi:Protein of unknown function (DUF3016)
MKTNVILCLSTLIAAVAAIPATAAVSVTFTHPENYTDAGYFSVEAKRAMEEIEKELKYLGDRYLPPNQELKVEVLDVDLAGRIDPAKRRLYDVRVLRGTVDWPSIDLHYVLEAEGRVLADQREVVSDMAYLNRIPNVQYSSESFPYEKRMLEDWFKARFAEKKPVQ